MIILHTFLIRIGDSSIIGIENQLHSPEGDQQTNYYARRITKDFPDADCDFIFLTPGEAKASSN
ncbi:MAG: hypothetical protein MUO67_00580 [Anaerolineales bacterium]|nr:hypothetical protein [Anaerolineales bacterium]